MYVCTAYTKQKGNDEVCRNCSLMLTRKEKPSHLANLSRHCRESSLERKQRQSQTPSSHNHTNPAERLFVVSSPASMQCSHHKSQRSLMPMPVYPSKPCIIVGIVLHLLPMPASHARQRKHHTPFRIQGIRGSERRSYSSSLKTSSPLFRLAIRSFFFFLNSELVNFFCFLLDSILLPIASNFSSSSSSPFNLGP